MRTDCLALRSCPVRGASANAVSAKLGGEKAELPSTSQSGRPNLRTQATRPGRIPARIRLSVATKPSLVLVRLWPGRAEAALKFVAAKLPFSGPLRPDFGAQVERLLVAGGGCSGRRNRRHFADVQDLVSDRPVWSAHLRGPAAACRPGADVRERRLPGYSGAILAGIDKGFHLRACLLDPGMHGVGLALNLTVSIKSRHCPCFFASWVRSDGSCRAV